MENKTRFLEKKIERANDLVNHYNYLDRKKFGESGDLDRDWIIQNIFGSKCVYCGTGVWTKLGCDRIDNSKPHTKDNCVCSCARCNRMRGDNFTVEEMKKIGKVIAKIDKNRKQKEEEMHRKPKCRKGKRVAKVDIETGEILKVYRSTAETKVDGYSRTCVGKAANHFIDSNGREHSTYRGFLWKFI